jgi:hypothetical protein
VRLRVSPNSKLASIQLPLRQQLYNAASKFSSGTGPAYTFHHPSNKKLFPRVMVSRKSSSQLSSSSSSSSTKSTKSPASTVTDWDADDEDAMSEDYAAARPLSVAIPVSDVSGPYCPRRPNLKEILANSSPTPWTLAAFMAYLSNNHCLETLEFTMDAGRYKKHFAKMMSRASSAGLPPSKDRDYVRALWQRLVDAYIRPNGSREVNLPSDVRDPILDLVPGDMPPPPETLDTAVAKIYELMEESVLVPFLNSAYPQTAHPTVQSCPYDTSEESMPARFEDRSARRRGAHGNARNSPPPQSAVEPHSNSYSAPSTISNRKSAPSTLTTSLNKARFSVKLSSPTTTTSSPAHMPVNSIDSATSGPFSSDLTQSASGFGSGTGMTDDSGNSTDSPTNGDSPMTPPMSPPMGDAGSPKRDSGMWKKLGRLSGMKVGGGLGVGKRKSHGGLKEEPQ